MTPAQLDQAEQLGREAARDADRGLIDLDADASDADLAEAAEDLWHQLYDHVGDTLEASSDDFEDGAARRRFCAGFTAAMRPRLSEAPPTPLERWLRVALRAVPFAAEACADAAPEDAETWRAVEAEVWEDTQAELEAYDYTPEADPEGQIQAAFLAALRTALGR